MLAFIAPMLPSLAEEPPTGVEWQHEIKHDGYRTQIVIEDGVRRAFTRNGHDWTERYWPIIGVARGLACSSAVLDGEVIVQDEHGRSDFHALKAAIYRTPERLTFIAFDLLHLDGRDLRREPLCARREALERLLGQNRPDSPLQFSSHLDGDGAAFLAAVDAVGLEGIVSKKVSSRYTSGRTKDWLKVKTFEENEFVVIGTEREPGRPSIALLARETADGLVYAGGAAVTLKERDRETFWRAMEELSTPLPALPVLGKGEWARPELKVRARYLRNEERLRHATLTAVLDRD